MSTTVAPLVVFPVIRSMIFLTSSAESLPESSEFSVASMPVLLKIVSDPVTAAYAGPNGYFRWYLMESLEPLSTEVAMVTPSAVTMLPRWYWFCAA